MLISQRQERFETEQKMRIRDLTGPAQVVAERRVKQGTERREQETAGSQHPVELAECSWDVQDMFE